jgi:lysozyme
MFALVPAAERRYVGPMHLRASGSGLQATLDGPTMNRARVIVFGLALVAAGICLALDQGALRFNYPSASRYPVRGIDVSHHQGAIDWAAVRGDGIAFAYIKATEGGDHVDPRFTENWTRARAAGVIVGAYHFFTFCRDGATQARSFLSVVPRDRDALPPAVDLESDGNCSRTPSAGELRAELETYLRLVRDAYGREPVIYVTEEFTGMFPEAAPHSPLWVRDVLAQPDWLATLGWTLWQYADRGVVRGISGVVDLDVFSSDVPSWTRFHQGASDTSPATMEAGGG